MLTTSLRTIIAAQLRRQADLSMPADSLRLTLLGDLSDGSDSGEADQLWHDTRQLAAEAAESIDLAGVLINNVGEPVSLEAVKVLLVSTLGKNNQGPVRVGPAAVNGWLGPWGDASDHLVLVPESYLLLASTGAGWPVVAGTGDLLSIDNPSTEHPLSYDIVVIGVNA